NEPCVIATLADVFGRTIKIEQGTYHDAIVQAGFNGASLQWNITKTWIQPNFTYECILVVAGIGPYSGSCQGPTFVQVITRIDLPFPSGPLSYIFGYTDNFGELTDVTLPYGGSVHYTFNGPGALGDVQDIPIISKTLTYHDP